MLKNKAQIALEGIKTQELPGPLKKIQSRFKLIQ